MMNILKIENLPENRDAIVAEVNRCLRVTQVSSSDTVHSISFQYLQKDGSYKDLLIETPELHSFGLAENKGKDGDIFGYHEKLSTSKHQKLNIFLEAIPERLKKMNIDSDKYGVKPVLKYSLTDLEKKNPCLYPRLRCYKNYINTKYYHKDTDECVDPTLYLNTPHTVKSVLRFTKFTKTLRSSFDDICILDAEIGEHTKNSFTQQRFVSKTN